MVGACATTQVETNTAVLSVTKGSISVAFQPQQIRTIRVVPGQCSADPNADGRTDGADLSILLAGFG